MHPEEAEHFGRLYRFARAHKYLRLVAAAPALFQEANGRVAETVEELVEWVTANLDLSFPIQPDVEDMEAAHKNAIEESCGEGSER